MRCTMREGARAALIWPPQIENDFEVKFGGGGLAPDRCHRHACPAPSLLWAFCAGMMPDGGLFGRKIDA